MNVNYEYYKIFYYVAKYKNLTQAAEVLHNNQPNISRTIKLLEHEFGCNLLVRSNRGISLTPEGEQLYTHVKVMVEQIQTAEEEILKSSGLQKGTVTIGASETALHMLLLPVLNRFKQSYPGIRIRILNHLTTLATHSVKNELVDFAVVTTPANIVKPLTAYPILTFHDILLGGPSYAYLADSTLSLKDLDVYPFITLGEDTMFYKFYEDLYRRNKLILKPDLEAATTDQILPMIKNDLGIGFIPEPLAVEALQKKEVFQLSLLEEIPAREVCFVENEHHPLSTAAKALKKLLMQDSNYSLPSASSKES